MQTESPLEIQATNEARAVFNILIVEDILEIGLNLIAELAGELLDFYRIIVESFTAAIRAWGRHGFDGCLMVCPACRVAKEHVTLVSKKLSGNENFALAA